MLVQGLPWWQLYNQTTNPFHRQRAYENDLLGKIVKEWDHFKRPYDNLEDNNNTENEWSRNIFNTGICLRFEIYLQLKEKVPENNDTTETKKAKEAME